MGAHVADVLMPKRYPAVGPSDSVIRAVADRWNVVRTTTAARLAIVREIATSVKVAFGCAEGVLVTTPGLLHRSSRFYGIHRVTRCAGSWALNENDYRHR